MIQLDGWSIEHWVHLAGEIVCRLSFAPGLT